MDTVAIPVTLWEHLHLYLDHHAERMAFLAAVADGEHAWRVTEVMYLDDDRDYEYQGWAGVELADDIRPRTLKWASGMDAALIEVHSHGAGRLPTTFSTIDLLGLIDGAPRLVWRLGGRPYGAIVVGGRKDHDSLTWASKESAPTPIGQLTVGSVRLAPTALALDRIDSLKE
jgi:hypothetical protein